MRIPCVQHARIKSPLFHGKPTHAEMSDLSNSSLTEGSCLFFLVRTYYIITCTTCHTDAFSLPLSQPDFERILFYFGHNARKDESASWQDEEDVHPLWVIFINFKRKSFNLTWALISFLFIFNSTKLTISTLRHPFCRYNPFIVTEILRIGANNYYQVFYILHTYAYRFIHI